MIAALWAPKDIIARVAFAIESRWWAAVTGLALTSDSVLQYLSTHPATEERIQRAEQHR